MKLKRDLYALALVLCSVSATYFVTVSTAQQGMGAGTGPASANNEYQVGATLYMQKAAEYRALAYQAFNVARLRLDEDFRSTRLSKLSYRRPRAIIVDIDETVLDNSPAQAYLIKNRLVFNNPGWYAWGEMRKAKATPGSVDFLNYAVSKDVRVFFVSNRDELQKQATIDNLKAAGFRDVSGDNVVLRQTESTKEPRRQAIAAKYRIVLQMGDNLDDFSNVFERKSVADRFAAVDKAREEFGKRFIVLPNAIYGTWENAIYNYERLTEEKKAERRVNALELP